MEFFKKKGITEVQSKNCLIHIWSEVEKKKRRTIRENRKNKGE